MRSSRSILFSVVVAALTSMTSSSACLPDEEGCTTPRREAFPCDSVLECEAGLDCIFDGGPGTGTCQPRLALDEECSFGGRRCLEGLACAENFGASNTCRQLSEPGERCTNGLCPEGFHCTFDAAVSDSTCQPLPLEGEQCPSQVCAPGLSCDVEGITAVCRPAPGVGEPCPSFACTADAFCDGGESPFVCRARDALGERCSSLAESCEEGLHCLPADAVCAPIPTLCEQ